MDTVIYNNPGDLRAFAAIAEDKIKRSMAIPEGILFAAGGDKHALRPDLGNRLFAVVATDAAIQAGEVVDPNWPFSDKQLRADIQAAALKLRASDDPPIAWIIERDGRVTMIHYEKCAVKAAANGYIVTPYYSKVRK